MDDYDISYEDFQIMGGPMGNPRPPLGMGVHRVMMVRQSPTASPIPMPVDYLYSHPKPRYYYGDYPIPNACFCTKTTYDSSKQRRTCVGNTCGICVPKIYCKTCEDEKFSCSAAK